MTEQPADLNQRFRAAVEHFPSSFAIYDRERRFEFVNAAVLRETGLEERQFLGRRDDEVFPPDLTAGYLAALNRAFDEKRAQTIELSLPPRLGARDYVITYIPQLDADGNVERVYGVSEEVTGRKRAERLTAGLNCVLELLATGGSQSAVLTALVKMVQEQCRGVVASVLVLDETGRRLRHGAAPDLPAALVREADGLEIGPAAGSCGTAAFRGERVVSEDLRIDPLWAGARAVAAHCKLKACWSQPIFSRDEQVLGTFALYPDAARGPDESEIHLLESAAHVAGVAIEHDRAQAALRRAKEEAEAANLAKDDFLASVSHELRTPIGAVLLWAKLLRSGNLDPEGQRQALDTIVRAAEDQKRLVNTLLDASRILHGRLQAELRPLALSKLVREAVAAMRPSAQAKGVELNEVLCEAPALGDPPLLRQVVTNLVDNALKFTPAGGRVQVRLTRQSDAAQIEVVDTGAGMSPEFLPHAFDRFRQGDASIDRAHGGLGLGLSIVRGLVELHGGTVRAASEGPGRGSTFTVTLPLGGSRTKRREDR